MKTLFDRLWDAHAILTREDGATLLWVDRHYVHESSHHAFSRIREKALRVAQPGLTVGVADHYVPTRRAGRITDPAIARMFDQLSANTAEHGVMLLGLDDPRQENVHVAGPEQGLTLPGMLVVCDESHTATHGALAAWGFGIGATEVAHVLATQTIWKKRPKRMRLTFTGSAAPGVGAKDMALHWIARLGADGARGHVIEYAGPAVRALSVEGRMTLCNLSIEGGGRAAGWWDRTSPCSTGCASGPLRLPPLTRPVTDGRRWPPTRAPVSTPR